MSDVLPSIIVLAITTLLVFRHELTTPRAKKGAPRAAAARSSTTREAYRCGSEGAASCVHRTEVTGGGDDDAAVIFAFR